MLQTGRSRVLVQVRWIYFSLQALWVTHPLTELSTRNRKMFLGSKVRPVLKADTLTAICDPIN
jgi:hypothetical protein